MIREGHFAFARREAEIRAEAALDGIYVLRANVPEEHLRAAEVVCAYKRLSRVEDAFRSLKSVDLELRPIYHRLEERVRAHAFGHVLSSELLCCQGHLARRLQRPVDHVGQVTLETPDGL
ncbi:MAG: transposase, partial [Actinobacteria bacterium]|nr:transposase [Actinomycetota bacterium]